jgi:hypothetical protein
MKLRLLVGKCLNAVAALKMTNATVGLESAEDEA